MLPVRCVNGNQHLKEKLGEIIAEEEGAKAGELEVMSGKRTALIMNLRDIAPYLGLISPKRPPNSLAFFYPSSYDISLQGLLYSQAAGSSK